MESINKLVITLSGSAFEDIKPELKLKIYSYKVGKFSEKTVTIVDGNRSLRKSLSEVNVVSSEHHNNTFDCITFYCYCDDNAIEVMTEQLITAVKERFKYNERVYKSALEVIDQGIKVVAVI